MNTSLVNEFRTELKAIADWWMTNTVDEVNGGFIGEISNEGEVNALADKGIILNTRILWFFSEAAIFSGDVKYREMATRAYTYMLDHFVDREFGGVYWALNALGEVVNDRKQIYAQAFAIYGLSAYYKLTSDERALELAESLFAVIEKYGHDDVNQGYLEAWSRKWGDLEDVRLSEKDLNSPKSMNTHLHILEAYTTLYTAKPSEDVATAMKRCLSYFDERIINKENLHLRMFLGMDWSDESTSFSYGHDIEASWLIWEAVEALHDETIESHYKPTVIALAEMILDKGIGEHGEVLDAYNFTTDTLLDERVWWVQAEALVGFLTAYTLTNDEAYYKAFLDVWAFINKYQKDVEGGEWHWLSTLDLPHKGDCKMGPWKGPYHNGRAMMEVCKLFDKLGVQ